MATIFSAVVSAEKNIKFINHCPYDVYSWSVGPTGSGWQVKDHQAVTIPANTVTYQGMVNCEATNGGISVKLRDLPHHEVAPAGIIQVEYNLVPGQNHLWYDLSAIDCDHSVGPEHASFCPLIGSGMKVCDAGKDIVVESCTACAGPRTFDKYNETGHHEPQPDKKPGNPTTNGVCGAKTSDRATCYGYAHGDCCSRKIPRLIHTANEELSKYTPAYSASSYSTPSYLPPYTSPPYRTTYATHTITKTSPYIIKTVTVSAGTGYHSPSSWYSAPTYSIPYYEQPGFTHTPQQEPQIPSNWYNRPTNSSVYVALTPSSQYYESSASEYTAPTPVFSQPWFDPPLSMPPADMHTDIRNGFENH
ncbi:hypothetical protein SLS61_000774 [Didymella pomorum]